MIPAEAVEAVWDKLHENPRHPIAIQYSELQAALEAAAPHMHRTTPTDAERGEPSGNSSANAWTTTNRGRNE